MTLLKNLYHKVIQILLLFQKHRTYYNDEYQGTGTASETVGFDFKFVNESGGLRCFVRQNNEPSSSNLVNRTNPLTGTVNDYKFTKDRYPYVSQYTESGQKLIMK